MSNGINTQSDTEAELQIGPTDQGMVRIFVSSSGAELPMDFTPEEALEIANELKAAADRAQRQTGGANARRKKGQPHKP